MTATAAVTRALRSAGLTVVTGTPKWNDDSNAWVISRGREARVINCQVTSIMGMGCYGKPGYEANRDALTARVMDALKAAGIEFVRSRTPDQLFLSGYRPTEPGREPVTVGGEVRY